MNITKLTEEYIYSKPFIRESIKRNIINYSKLARIIEKEHNIKNFDAILIAIRRYAEKLGKTNPSASILDLLQGSKLSIKNKIIAVILEPDIPDENLIKLQEEVNKKNEIIHVIRGENAITLITTRDFLGKINNMFRYKIIKQSENLVEIVLKSPHQLESIPGVMGYLYSLFSENNINIVETMSCWTDTIFVISEKDLTRTMEVLSF